MAKVTAFDRVRQILVNHLNVSPNKVTREASIIDDLGADSLDRVELIMAFEEEFGFEVSDSEAARWLLVRDAVKFAERMEARP